MTNPDRSLVIDNIGMLVTNDPTLGRGALGIVENASVVIVDGTVASVGPAGAVADDPRLPDTWSETTNVTWKTDIPGLGWSSPVVWDDHVFLTTAVSAGEERQPVRGI